MASSVNTFVIPSMPQPKNIISGESKQDEEYLLTLSTVKWKHNIQDEQLAKLLQEEYNKENIDNSSIYESDSHISRDTNCHTNDVETGDDEKHWEKLFPVLKEYDKALLYLSKSKHNVIKSKKCKHIIPGVDPKAKLILNKMIDKGLFDKIVTVLFKGREFTILRASKWLSMSPYEINTKFYDIKVFHNTQLVIEWIYDPAKQEYIRSETYSPSTNTKLAQSKAEKEVIYYQRLKKAGIRCPDVIALKQHVLVLSAVAGSKAVPMLKHEQMHKIMKYEQIMHYMKILYEKCNLIRGNLSKKDILWFDSPCYLINLSQALEPHEKNAYHLLFNDCKNVYKFFKKLKVPNVVTPEKLFLDITGCHYSNQAALEALQETKRKNHVRMSSHNKV